MDQERPWQHPRRWGGILNTSLPPHKIGRPLHAGLEGQSHAYTVFITDCPGRLMNE